MAQYVENDFLDSPVENVPDFIAAWIYTTCDPYLQQNKATLTYAHALKMRAAISFHYNQLGKSGPWHQAIDKSWQGNPSLSNTVARYMVSLQRRKVYLFYNINFKLVHND